MLNSYKELNVWQESIKLVQLIYKITLKFPSSELYGLTSQMRRASISIPSNIAEGYKRNNRKEYIQFLGIANGSSAELETQIIISKSIYPNSVNEGAEKLLTEIQKKLHLMINILRNEH